jgi:predicted outer membrane lipoprotein
MSGVWIGLLVNVLPHSAQVAAEGSDAVAGGVGLACALALVGGALWLERCCRTPDDEQGPSGDGSEG